MDTPIQVSEQRQTLAAMLREAGHDVALYDPIYAPDRAAVAAGAQYDFVTCTEAGPHCEWRREHLVPIESTCNRTSGKSVQHV